MKLSGLTEKRQALLSKRQEERDALNLVLREMAHGKKAAILNAFLNAYAQTFSLEISDFCMEHFALVWDGTLLTVQNHVDESVLFVYGVDGLHEPSFFWYSKEKKHTKHKTFRFWTKHQVMSLCTAHKDQDLENTAAQHITVDSLHCVLKYLNCDDVLSCRIVCKSWAHACSKDSVWSARILGSTTGTGLADFVKTAALLSETTAQSFRMALLNDERFGDIVMTQIGRAVMHQLTRVIVGPVSPEVCRINKEGDEQKRRRRVAAVVSLQHHLALHVGRVSHTVHCVVAYCVFENSGALAWLSPDGVLKAADPDTVKGSRKLDTPSKLRRLMLDYANHTYFDS